jgi:hypothetical protein
MHLLLCSVVVVLAAVMVAVVTANSKREKAAVDLASLRPAGTVNDMKFCKAYPDALSGHQSCAFCCVESLGPEYVFIQVNCQIAIDHSCAKPTAQHTAM